MSFLKLSRIGLISFLLAGASIIDCAKADFSPAIWAEFFRTLDTKDPVIQRNRKVIREHLQEGIEIASSRFPDGTRIELMRDWIARSRKARTLGTMDPVSLRVRYELSRFEGLLVAPQDRLDLSFAEIAQTLNRAKKFVEAE